MFDYLRSQQKIESKNTKQTAYDLTARAAGGTGAGAATGAAAAADSGVADSGAMLDVFTAGSISSA